MNDPVTLKAKFTLWRFQPQLQLAQAIDQTEKY